MDVVSKFFEIDADEMTSHVAQMKKMAEAERNFRAVTSSFFDACFFLNAVMGNSHERFIDKAEESAALLQQAMQMQEQSESIVTYCLQMYEQVIAREWSEDRV